MHIIAIFVLIGFQTALLGGESNRVWRLQSGMAIEGTLAGDDGTNVTIIKKSSGQKIQIRRKDLTKADILYLQEVQKAIDSARFDSVGFKMLELGMSRDACMKLVDGVIWEYELGIQPARDARTISLKPGPAADAKYKTIGSAGNKNYSWILVEIGFYKDRVKEITVWGPAYRDAEIGTELLGWLSAGVEMLTKEYGKPQVISKASDKEAGASHLISNLKRLSFYDYANWKLADKYEISVCANYEKVEGKYQGFIKYVDTTAVAEEKKEKSKKPSGKQ
jgi:hypothetical protein